ncbi:MAG TPA: hypothetical protein VFY03_02330 [Woeseiaceae bacterium]|nr:hypothetical protein [Woeseiaceae bacterium]
MVSWSGVVGAAYYELQSRPSGGAWIIAQSSTAIEFHETGKMPGGWGYRVRACDGSASCSNWTAEKTVAVSGAGEATLEANTVAGATAYSSGVTKGGNGYLTVPIAVVPGVNGMQPGLSIAFNSGRPRQSAEQNLPADTLGYGFSLNGVPSLRRCLTRRMRLTAVLTTLCLLTTRRSDTLLRMSFHTYFTVMVR